jgi:hypothetical protein
MFGKLSAQCGVPKLNLQPRDLTELENGFLIGIFGGRALI